MTSEDIYARHKVSVPTGRCGGMAVERFVVEENEPGNLRLALHGRTMITPGTYTRLTEGGTVWMSDVPEEMETHAPAFNAIFWARPGARVLIHGLGLGMVVQYALRAENVSHVDVVELDERVIALAGPHYEAMAAVLGTELNILHGDAHERIWAPGTRWDVVWHDIWPSYSEDNLPEMARLHRSFGHRCGWQGSWGRKQCERIKSGAYHREHERIMARFLKSIGADVAIAELRAKMAIGAVDERGGA
jgi:hypothetical protein